MAHATKQQLFHFLNDLAAMGQKLAGEVSDRRFADPVEAAIFFGKCKHVLYLLGDAADHWRADLDRGQAYRSDEIPQVLGTLLAIMDIVRDDLLFHVTQLVAGEIFYDLLDQADHLCEQTYYVASAVVARGVLEGHLRKWCEHLETTNPAVPLVTKANATINDYNTALCKTAKVYGVSVMQNVTSLAKVGNDAAHQQIAPESETRRMLTGVRTFLRDHRPN